MARIIGRGRYAGETYPEAPKSGGTPGADTPLSSAFWVDPGTTATSRNGSDEAPFISLQEAYNATSSLFNISFLLVPSAALGGLTIPDSASPRLSLVGMGGSNREAGALVAVGAIVIGAGVSFNLGFQGVDLTNGINADNSAVGTIEITDSECDTTVLMPNASTQLFATNVIFGGNVTVDNLTAQNVQWSPESTLNIAGVLSVDGVSNYYLTAGGVTVVAGTKVITELDT